MLRNDVPLEILYELAMSIGNSTNLEENLQESLGAYLQKLHCCAGAVFAAVPDRQASLVKSIPRPSTIARNEGYRAAMEYPGWTAAGLPSKGSTGWDYFYHWFVLPDYGWLLLIRTHQPLSTGLQNALLDINNKLAQSARSCRANEVNLHESRLLLRNILDTIPVRVFWKDRDLRYLGCNAAFARDKGLASPEEVVGRNDPLLSWTPHVESYRADDRTVIETGQPLRMYEEMQTKPDGDDRWIRTSKIPLRDGEGKIFGVLGTYEDITREKRNTQQIQKQLREREALLAEIHHRVFNNLSVISGLLNVRATQDSIGEETVRVLRDTRVRIESMALVYRNLYSAGDYGTVNMREYCREAVGYLKQTYARSLPLEITVVDDPIDLPLDKAVPCALIINELVTNAMQHAFSETERGRIVLSVRPSGEENEVVLEVGDDGDGIPETVDIENVQTLGFQLVLLLTKQLRGEFFSRRTDGLNKVGVVFSSGR